MRHAALVLLLAACSSDRPDALAFHKQLIDPEFRAEGITTFDVDHDGHLDLVTDQLWYRGPDFTPHEVTTPQTFDVTAGYASSFGVFHLDLDGDGYEDLVSFGLPDTPAKWCRNPRGADVHWDCFQIHPDEFEESPLITDALGGQPTLLMGVGTPRVLGSMEPGDPPTDPWTVHPITADPFAPMNHGMGYGDLDGDGRADLLTGAGWFEQPGDPSQVWPFVPEDWCPDNCSHMFVYDFDGDGRADVIGASPHNYGAWWWHQEADGSFTQHVIDDTISENHSAALVDLDGDGSPEFVTGKRYWAHFDHDAGALDPILLAAYKYSVTNGEVSWDRVVLDEGVGVGSHQLEVTDVDRDGRPDIVVATRKGIVLFRHE
jgi:hypothetical protein